MMAMGIEKKTTHFGYQSVNWKEKESKVRSVFNSVAPHYDLMNDLMSFGIHRLWKWFAIERTLIRPHDLILDLAAGSGDLSKLLYQKLGPEGRVISTDINAAMLHIGRNRLINQGINLDFIQADAESLPFCSNQFNLVTMGFGLRNVRDQAKALASIYRVCKPGGKILILEFSQSKSKTLKFFYDWYSFHVIPRMGQLFAQDADSYQYLAESIRMHPDQETLKSMIESAGFEDCQYHDLSHGIVALHIAYKF